MLESVVMQSLLPYLYVMPTQSCFSDAVRTQVLRKGATASYAASVSFVALVVAPVGYGFEAVAIVANVGVAPPIENPKVVTTH